MNEYAELGSRSKISCKPSNTQKEWRKRKAFQPALQCIKRFRGGTTCQAQSAGDGDVEAGASRHLLQRSAEKPKKGRAPTISAKAPEAGKAGWEASISKGTHGSHA